ncbi:MAG: flagellar biosynthetic protein FliO [Thermoguttaceae bacterium]
MRRWMMVVGLVMVAVGAARWSAADAAPLSSDAQPATLQSSDAMPLKPHDAARDEPAKRPNFFSPVTIGGSLALVLGIFLALVWLIRRAAPGRIGPLPTEVFETLGRAPLANRQQAQLIRCGPKLLLAAISMTDARPLLEIDDPEEVERLTMLCRSGRLQTPLRRTENRR